MSHPEPWKPEEPGIVWRRRVFKAAALFCLLLVAVLGYDRYDAWRYESLLAKSRAAVALGDWTAGSFALRRAAQIRPGNLEPRILLAEAAEKLSPADAVGLRYAVAMADQGSMRHRFELARTALKVGDTASAQQALASIDPIARRTATYLALKSQVDLALQNYPSAEAAALEALRIEPSNSNYRLHLAGAQIESTNAATRASARKALEQLAAIPGHRDEAIRRLSIDAINRRDAPVARKWVEEIFRSGKTGFGDEIQQLALLKLEKSPAFDARMESLQRRAATNVQQAVDLGTWMMVSGDASGAIRWLASLGTNITAVEVVRNLRIQCHLLMKDGAGCIAWLEGDSWGVNDHHRHLWLARLHHALKKDAPAKAAWNAARDKAAANPAARRQLWGVAVELRWKEEAMQVLEASSRGASDSRWAQMLLFDHYYKEKKTPKMLEVSERILRASPDDWFAKNNVATFSLLLNTNVPVAARLAAEAAAARPHDPAITSTHAYALQKTGKVSEALVLFGRVPEAVRSRPGVAVYYASALVEAGRVKEARKYLTLAEDPSLLPEERSLLGASLLKAAEIPDL